MPDEPCDPPMSKPVPFWKSHRFWSVVAAVAGGLPTTGTAVAAGVTMMAVNPIVGGFMLAGAGLSLAATAGLAWWGIKSNRHVEWKVPEPIKRQFKRNGGPPLAPQP